MTRIDLDAIAQSLSADHDAPADRRESALLVDLIDSIDDAIARGISRATVLARLHDGGFTMSLPTFIKALQRTRKRLGRPAPRRRMRSNPDHKPAAQTPSVERSDERRCAPNPIVRDKPLRASAASEQTIKSHRQLQRENPELSSVQISKLVAQQYADQVVTADELEEMKRRYKPPTVAR